MPDKGVLMFTGLGAGLGLFAGVLIARGFATAIGIKMFADQQRNTMTTVYKLLVFLGIILGMVGGVIAGFAISGNFPPARLPE